MKWVPVVLVLTVLVALSAGCSRDDEVVADLGAVETFTTELISKVESGPDPVAGVDAAQAYLESERANVTERMQRVGSVRGFQISDETKQRVAETVMDSVSKVNMLKVGLMMQTMQNKELDMKLGALIDAYNDLISIG